MPENILGWIMFVFFSGGALGGWMILYLAAREFWKDGAK